MSLTAYASETKKLIYAFKKEQKSRLHSERTKKWRVIKEKKKGGRPPKTLVVFLSLRFPLLRFHFIRTSKAGYFWPKKQPSTACERTEQPTFVCSLFLTEIQH